MDEKKFQQMLQTGESNVISKIENTNSFLKLCNENLESHILKTFRTDKLRCHSQVNIQELNQTLMKQNQTDSNKLEEQLHYLKQLQSKEAAHKTTLANLEAKLNSFKKTDLIKQEAHKVKLERYRNFCKASKELTHTSFNYQNGDISGLVLNEAGKMEVFTLNRKKLSNEEVAEHLWKNLALASGENWMSKMNSEQINKDP